MRNTFASFKKRCVEESGVTQAMIDQFSDAEDLNKLPEQHELKCYIYCQYREMEMMDTVHPAIQMEILLENVESLGPVASEIFLNMGKKCSRLKYKTTDLCEVAYKFNVCLKKGDIHVSFLLVYISDFKWYFFLTRTAFFQHYVLL